MRLCISIFFITFSLFSFGQLDKSQIKRSTKTLGSYYITNKQDSLEVYFNVDKIIYSKELKYNWEDCDVSFSISDKNRKELYRRNFPSYNGDGSNIITAELLKFSDLGNFLFVTYNSIPSCGGCGYEGQVFGMNSLGYIVPITGIIHIDYGEEKSVNNLNPIWAYLQQDKGLVTEGKCKECKPYIEVITHTGYCGLNTVEYYNVSLEGIFLENKDATYPFFNQQISLDDKISDRFMPNKSNSIIDTLSFYSSPHKCKENPQLKFIKGSSIIRFLDLKINDEGFWLRMRINGYEGFVNIDDEYKKFGFEPCE